jgi:hypothetical protein
MNDKTSKQFKRQMGRMFAIMYYNGFCIPTYLKSFKPHYIQPKNVPAGRFSKYRPLLEKKLNYC